MAQKPLGHNTLPHLSYQHDVADVAAVKALAVGEASPDQQIRAFKWIIERGCMTYDETFDHTNERASAFMQGRRFVGLKLVLFLKLSITALKTRVSPGEGLSETGV